MLYFAGKTKHFDFFNEAHQKHYQKVMKLPCDIVCLSWIANMSLLSLKVPNEKPYKKMLNNGIIKIHIFLDHYFISLKKNKLKKNSLNLNYVYFQALFNHLKFNLTMVIFSGLHYNNDALQSMKLTHPSIVFP